MRNDNCVIDNFERTWDENPGLIREFLDINPKYKQLCNEVQYIIEKRLNENSIEVSLVSSRTKTLKSFLEKLTRKDYHYPFKEIKDFAGVRIVYLYKRDRPLIEKIIESEFNILEKVDKVEEQDANRFGYGALHYLVKLGKNTSGARYDDLKEFICEIQVRTVLQDAWAIIAHHLSYKKESDVPGVLRRKLNSLAGLFETADDQFDRIREERDKYRQAVVKKLKIHRTRLRESANIDSLTELLKLQYPDLKIEIRKGQLEHVLCRANKYGYFSLEDVRSLLKRTDEARDYFAKECPRKSGAGEIARAIAFDAPESRHLGGWSKSSICLFKDLQNKVLKKMRRTKHPTNVL